MRGKTNWVILGLLGLALAAFLATPALGQAVYGSIYGIVTDPTGAAIPAARVVITSLGQGTTQEVTTNAAGNYVATHLIPGKYDVRVEASGFKSYEATGIEIFADVGNRVDAQLEVGAVGETITVTAEEVPLLKTDRADVAVTFTSDTVEELPIFNRNFTQFQLLTPGSQMLAWQHASSENPQGSLQTMVNGQHFSGTSFQLDGTDNRDPILGIIVINPTLESVTAYKTTSQNYDAEFGMALAGVTTAQTKSGTNEIHGSAFWFRRDDETQARDPFTQSVPDALTGKLLPNSMWQQFGGSLGGPVVKDRLFLFGDYQGSRRDLGNSDLVNVPTDLVRSTCLAGLPCDLSEYGVQIFDPSTGNPDGTGRTEFPGAVIPAGRISPQAVALLSLLPGPNAPGIEENFSKGGGETFDDDAFNIRGDYHHTDNLHIFGRYSWADFTKSAVGIFGEEVGGPGLGDGGFAGSSLVTNQSIAAGFDYVLSPSLLTDFRFGWFKYDVAVLPGGFGTTPAADAGIPGLNLDDFTSGMPRFAIEGVGGFNFGFALDTNRCNCPLKEKEWQVQFVNNWTLIRGNHSFKFGTDIRHARNLRVPSDAHRAGQLGFNDGRTSLAGVGGLGLATYLLGDVTFFERFTGTSTDAAERQNRLFFYGQDTWRLSPKWTFSYGLRWEILLPEYVNADGNGAWVDLETGLANVGGIGPIDRDGNIKKDWNAFAPRLGLAYQATEKTVVRLGYGRSFDIGVFGSLFGHVVTQNLPVLALQQQRSPGDSPFLAAFNLATGPETLDLVALCDFSSDGTCPQPGNIAARIRPNKMILPTVDQWNVTVQHQLTPTLSFEVAYVGNKGTHVFAGDGPAYNNNPPILEGFLGADGVRGVNPATGVNDDISPDDRKPFNNGPINGFGNSFGWTSGPGWFGNDADNNYHSLQLKAEKRFSAGLSFLAHYTWSKNLGFEGDYFVWDRAQTYGPTSFDRTHSFVANSLWEIPIGRGKRVLGDASGALDRIVGGWQINTVWTYSSGFPFTPGIQNCDAFRDTGPCRPDVVGDVSSGGDRNGWFTTTGTVGLGVGESAGPWALPSPGSFGSVTRNLLRGPELFNLDLGIMKKTTITEQITVEFTANAFNVVNHVNLGQPNSCVDCNTAVDGTITSLAPNSRMRIWQFGLRVLF